MGCSNCSSYSFSLRRCKHGMINPKTVKQAKEAAEFMGVTYICDKDLMRSKLIRSESSVK